MDTDEPHLRPCKQLPSPTNDRQGSFMPMGQHLGIQSSSQGHVDHESPSNIDLEDTEDEDLDFGEESSKDDFEHVDQESSEAKVARLLKGKDRDWAAAAHRKRPLQLLDLPLDILKIILREVGLVFCMRIEKCSKPFHRSPTPMIWRTALKSTRLYILW